LAALQREFMVDPALVTTVDVERRIVVLGGRWFRVVRRRRDGQVSLSLRELDGEGQGSWRCQACVRVAEGGEARDPIDTGQGTFACALGGADGRTLFAAASTFPRRRDVRAPPWPHPRRRRRRCRCWLTATGRSNAAETAM
jgi:hypothetical protein